VREVAVTLAHVLVPRSAAWSAWQPDPIAIAIAALAGAFYAAGLHATGVRAVSRARAGCFVAGVAVALLATMSPLHAAADATFTAHMAQHMLFMFVAAPLIVAGRPALVMALALPAGVRRKGWRIAGTRPVDALTHAARHPLSIFVVYAAAVWLWHLPGLYQAAVRSEAVHALEHATFLATAMAFWGAVARTGPRRRVGYPTSMGLVVGTMMQSTWLAAVLTFGGSAYPIYARRAPLWGVDALADQQTAGSIMWIIPTIAYFGVLGVLFVRWMRALDARHARAPAAMEAP
jgi:putative membrane protein